MDAPQPPTALRVLRIGQEYIDFSNRHRERTRLYNELFDEFGAWPVNRGNN